MVKYCVAYGCKEKAKKESDVQFHRFPHARPEVLKEWVHAVRRENWSPTEHSTLCSKHFDKDSYEPRPGAIRKRLKPDAVPSIFNFPSHLQNNLPKRRKLIHSTPAVSQVIKLEQPETTSIPSIAGGEYVDSVAGLRIENTMHIDSWETESENDSSWCRDSNSESHVVLKEVISDNEINGPESSVDDPSSIPGTDTTTVNMNEMIQDSLVVADNTIQNVVSNPACQNGSSMCSRGYERRIAELLYEMDELRQRRMKDRKKIMALQQAVLRRDKKIAFLEMLIECDKFKDISDDDDDTLDMLDGELKENEMFTILHMS